MGCGGGNTSTGSTSNTPPPQVLNAYSNVVSQAQGLASQPLQQYNIGPNASNVVAGLSPQQQAGMSTIQGAQGLAQPYIQGAAQKMQDATTPLWPTLPQFSQQNIQPYMSPYTHNVTDSLKNLFNEQNAEQLQQVKGNATTAGAYGGDREAVAEAETARQQQLAEDPAMAQVLQQGYQSGLGAFQQQQQTQLSAEQANAWLNSQAGFGLGQLGQESLGTTLQGAQANIGAGGLSQALQQEQLNAPYQQFLQQQAYPYQQTNFLAGITEGIGSQMGGTGQSSMTQPGPSTGSQVAGGVMTAAALAALLLKRGGRVGLAGGGMPGDMPGNMGLATPGVPNLNYDIIAPPTPEIKGPGAPQAPQLPGMPRENTTSEMMPLLQMAAMKGRGGGEGDAGADNKRGGRTGFQMGGAPDATGLADPVQTGMPPVMAPDAAPAANTGLSAPSPVMGMNPNAQGAYQKISQMPVEQLQELAARLPPGSAYGNLVHRALEMRHMQPQTGLAANDNQGLAQNIAVGYYGGGRIHRDMGGSAFGGPPGTVSPFMPSLPDRTNDSWPAPGDPRVGTAASSGSPPPTASSGPGMEAYLAQIYAGLGQSTPRPHRADGGDSPEDYNGGPAAPGYIDQMPPRVDDPRMSPDYQPFPQASDPGPAKPPVQTDALATADQSAEGLAAKHGISKNAAMGLMAAGLGMMASRSPHAAVGIGQGGLQGLQMYAGLEHQDQQNAVQQQKIAQDEERNKALEQHYTDMDKRSQIDTSGGTVAIFHPSTGERIDLGIPTEAALAKGATEKHQTAMEDIERRRLDQDQYSYEPWSQPDPTDPTKTITGLMRTSKKGNEKPTFVPTTGAPMPKDGTAAVFGGESGSGSDLHGDDYLKTLDPKIGNQVKALAEGRMNFPSGFSLKSPYWQNMIQSVSQYDPSFDAVNYSARSKTRNDFTAGKSAQNITSFNTAIGHLGRLKDSADALDNSWSDTYNTAANYLSAKSGDPRVNNFNLARNAVADELTRAFRGTGGSESEVQAWKSTLNASQSPEQLKGAIQTGVNLLRSRIDAVGEQYNRGMGTTSKPEELLSSEARKTLAKLEGTGTAEQSSSKQQSSTTDTGTPFTAASKDDYDTMKSGTRYRMPDDPPGAYRVKP